MFFHKWPCYLLFMFQQRPAPIGEIRPQSCPRRCTLLPVDNIFDHRWTIVELNASNRTANQEPEAAR
jgi:hypothetical protein